MFYKYFSKTILIGLKNSLILFIGSIIGLFTKFIAIIFFIRYIGDFQYGEFSTATNYINLLSLIADWGLNNYLIKEGAKSNERLKDIYKSIFIFRLITILISILTGIILIFFLPYTYQTKHFIFILLINIFLLGYNNLSLGLLYIKQKAFLITSLKIIEGILILTIYLILIILKMEGIYFVYTNVLVQIIICFYLKIIMTTNQEIKILYNSLREKHINFNDIKILFFPTLWFTLSLFLGVLGSKIDIFLLSLYLKADIIGKYSKAVVVYNVLSLIIESVYLSFLPIISKKIQEGKEIFSKIFKFSFLLIISAIIFITLFNILVPFIINILFRSSDIITIRSLQILSWDIVLIFATLPLSIYITVVNMQFIHVINASYMSVITILLGIILISKWGAIGIAIAIILGKFSGIIIGVPLALYFLKRKSLK